jgi:hypothetical protein
VKVRFVKVATPLAVLTVVVPPSVPPSPEKIDTVTSLELVTVLPDALRTVTLGCVVKGAPGSPGTGSLVITSDKVGTIKVSEQELAASRPGDANRRI